MNVFRTLIVLCTLFVFSESYAQITLIGENPPHANVNDGDFSAVRTYWRTGKMSPFWKAVKKDSTQDATMGLHYGLMYSASDTAIAESKSLAHPDWEMQIGDSLSWAFSADLEYVCQGSLSFALVFGENERLLAEQVKLVGADRKMERFRGLYVLDEEDVLGTYPFIRVYFYTEQGVKVWLDDITIKVLRKDANAPAGLQVIPSDGQNVMTWQAQGIGIYQVYRKSEFDKNYKLLDVANTNRYIDKSCINGVRYEYLVTKQGAQESRPSEIVEACFQDREAPKSPTYLEIKNSDAEVSIRWRKSMSKDVSYYSLYRKTPNRGFQLVADKIKKNSFLYYTAEKCVDIDYLVYADDYSGNRSKASLPAIGKTKMQKGASFRDLILPMPINAPLTYNTWGADGVLPRDVSNGVEDSTWSYWGGKPMKGNDGRYHMLVVRWAEGGMKGHWEWPNSEVVHSVSDSEVGPYKVTGLAYDYKNGLGHNADVTQLNDGRFLLYSLIEWEPTLFVADKMTGPWERLGVMQIDFDTAYWNDQRYYQAERNLSGVQLADGTMLFVTKFGRMMKSESGLLGPYKVLTDRIQNNTTIPRFYRHSNYDDPCLWYDGIQYHCLINAFLDKRAIYLRSGDGLNWVCDPGVAYDPDVTCYDDGTKTHWYKLERPHVLQDDYGRATHLSLAVMDVPKQEDLSKDNHSSKNLIVPLQKHRLLKLLSAKKGVYKVLIQSEEGFDAQSDLDLASLRLGAPSEVDYGQGAKVIKSKAKGQDLILYFKGKTGLTEQDFVIKLLGKTSKGELVLGFVEN